VLGDPDRLRQVVWNLLSNAIQFTPEGGHVRVKLERVEGATGGPQAQITITDSGQGIKQEFLPYVFDRFSQGDSSMTRKHGGLGLGLALVRHLIEMHGGTVMADSPGEGKGTSITVRLPLPQTQALSAESRYEDRSMVNTVSLSGLRVLVVDDESETREVLSALLVRYGAEVETCGSASEAFEKLQMWGPAILLSDIAMPGEDGYALINKVRSLEPERGGQVPAVALTALAGADDSNRAVSAGFHVHLPKPVDPFRLIKVITELTATERRAS
jgi:CheY-like chemotaxis protein